MTHDDHDHDMHAVALRLILAVLERSDHGLEMTTVEAAVDRQCFQCWYALTSALVSYAATGFELMDFDLAEALADPDYRIDPARTAEAIDVVLAQLADELDAKR